MSFSSSTSHQSSSVKRLKKVFIVDDHRLMIVGIRYILEDEEDFVICGSADNADDAVEWISAYHPDVVLLDISIRGSVDGIALAERLKERFPSVILLMLSMHDEAAYGKRAREVGASGYLNKADAPELLVKALRYVLSGGDFFTAHTSASMS